MTEPDFEMFLREAAKRRLSAAQREREALAAMNEWVRSARAAGVSVAQIAEWIGTTRQRVYEILREA